MRFLACGIVDVIVVDSATGWQLKMTFKVAYKIIRCTRAHGGVSDDSFGVRDAAPDVPTTSSPSPCEAGVKPRPVFQAHTPPMGIINRRAASVRS